MIDYLYEAERRYKKIRTLRRRLHKNAEIGFDVVETNKIINEELSRIGLVGKPCGQGGIICDIGNDEKDKILLRADIDALAMNEESGVSFSCKTGRMHSCGHDMHASMLLGAASIIKAHEGELKRGVTLLFQPAEEILEGAQDCLKHIDTSRYSACYALHVLCGVDLPKSSIVVPTVEIAALSADFFTIKLFGRSAHGATPHIGANAIEASCGVINSILGLLDQGLPKNKGVIINVGKIYGGSAANAVADKVEIAGNIRYMDYSLREIIIKRLDNLSKQTALLYGCDAMLEIRGGCPPLKISQELSKRFL
ncbi:MAG: amidohydrolase, partial [Ruminococcus sp.]|nr:amidohydrolase [Ruminococcus sp.]